MKIISIRTIALLLTSVLLITSYNAKAATWRAVGGSASVKPVYLGLTAASYTGNLGGIEGANAICVANYGAGARFMNVSDRFIIGRTTPWAVGWVNCDTALVDSFAGITACYAGQYFGFYGLTPDIITCSSFTSVAATDKGTIMHPNGVWFQACNTAAPLHCVK